MAEPIQDNSDIKKRATRRLIVAVGLVGILAGVLTWLSQYKPAEVPITTQPTPDTVIAPPVIAPEPAPIIAAPAEIPPEPPTPAETPAVAPPPPALPPTLGAPPPPPKVVSKPLPAPGPGPASGAAPTPLVHAEKTPAKPEAAPVAPPAPAAAPAAPAPSGYVVQFGVFANTQNALQLVERLKHAGIAAQTETRVQLPPFKTKAEAEAALAKMKEKGLSAVVVAR